MTDRRTDASGLNLQQRVFDALGAATSMLTMKDLVASTGLHAIVIINAIQRLRRLKVIRAICVDGVWAYGLRPGAERPTDRRGGARQMAQEMSA